MDMQISATGGVRLAHWGLLRARGSDAVKFLQGQLTSDVASLGQGAARLAGFCSAKGRLQATFIVWQDAAGDVLLACAASVLPATLKRLSMFVMRAQCKLTDATAEVPLHGLVGEAARAAMGEGPVWSKRDVSGCSVVRLPDAAGLVRCVVAGTAAGAAPLPNDLDLDLWRWLDVQSAVPWIEAATVDQFVPQMLNFELLGGVDFQKGCYPGQEVVARSQYRGTLKRRMFLFASDEAAAPGDEVYASTDPGQPAGMVVNAAPAMQGGWSLLVETKLSAVDDSSTLHLHRVGGPVLRRLELPYPLD